ncbi:Hypothetical predicted protein, partial [Paramuricea clavata]
MAQFTTTSLTEAPILLVFLCFLKKHAKLPILRLCLEVGDIVVMDNLSAHHYEGGEILEERFDTMGIQLLYTPSYCPDLNPIELCFNKVKTVLNGGLKDLVHTNLNLAVAEAVNTITTHDIVGFYEHTSYLFV